MKQVFDNEDDPLPKYIIVFCVITIITIAYLWATKEQRTVTITLSTIDEVC